MLGRIGCHVYRISACDFTGRFAIVRGSRQTSVGAMGANRRRFLQLASLASTTAVAGLGAARAGAEALASSLTCSEFERCVGDTFTFEKAVFGNVMAKLAAVDAHPGSQSAAEREGRFSLRFETK